MGAAPGYPEMNRRGLFLTCLVLLALGLGVAFRTTPPDQGPRSPQRPLPERYPGAPGAIDETWARKKFQAEHPHEKPLNWAIGQVAMRFYRTRPMGRFVLHENDCSDFVECVIDEALGVQARFKRGSAEHRIGERAGVFDYWYWEPGQAVQPGDVVHVIHSPWYAPQPASIGHVGVVGTDGQVYDFVKLRRWRQARYGRNAFGWFVRHSRAPRGVVIGRLKPEYRYRLRALPPGL